MTNSNHRTDTQTAFLNWYQPIHGPFIRYCSSKAFGLMSTEDLAQEAILATLSAFDKIQDKEKILGYMIGVVNNIIKNQLRRQKFRADWNEELLASVTAKVKDPETALDIQYLYKCIQQLNAKEQEAILLFEISGFSIKELSEIQESSEAAVKTRLHRARKELKKQLSGCNNKRKLSDSLALYASILF